MKPCVAVLLLSGLATLGGCGLEGTSCTAELRFHTIEVTREIATTEPADKLLVEACAASRCAAGVTPAASGTISFPSSFSEGPVSGSIAATADPGKKVVTVSYTVMESSKSELVLRIKRDDTVLLDDKARVLWSDDECHPTPTSTKL